MLNNCLLTGNLGADPEVFYSSEGDPIATFNLAFRSSKKKTNWIKITCFNKLAEIVEKHLHRGARIGDHRNPRPAEMGNRRGSAEKQLSIDR